MTQHVKNKFPLCGESAVKRGDGHRASVWLTPADLKLVRSLQKRLSTKLTCPGLTEIVRKALIALDGVEQTSPVAVGAAQNGVGMH